ncbi:UNVERIFIED_CONTAM: hypothetical protein GTU68_036180 [Idotea baltica]|nr:hypothetical protein [Idotea baltica]
MNDFGLSHIPARDQKPRANGMTMIMDKGLSTCAAQEMVDTAGDFIDIVKLGFGTAVVSCNLEAKLAVYKSAGIPYYFGGTLFEAYIARNQFDTYLSLIDKYQLEIVEVSDGCLELPHAEKCKYISILKDRVRVLSEVGSKDSEKIMPPYKWIELMHKELHAGAFKLIAEARESGTIGIFRSSGEVRMGLIEEILTQIPAEQIIWEAPQKNQQAWFIKLLGANVNLGNISPDEIIALEALRIGLRGDSFEYYLPTK